MTFQVLNEGVFPFHCLTLAMVYFSILCSCQCEAAYVWLGVACVWEDKQSTLVEIWTRSSSSGKNTKHLSTCESLLQL